MFTWSPSLEGPQVQGAGSRGWWESVPTEVSGHPSPGTYLEKGSLHV